MFPPFLLLPLLTPFGTSSMIRLKIRL
uniref:Uncharacterized protein n=1 Tax=Arundo donax TaxID=35708 RepID=A0A0A9H9R4_ARUDO